MNENPVKNLADVRALLPRLYSKSSLPVYESAFGRVERLTRRKLYSIPANRREWENISADIVWAGEFKSRVPGREERVYRDWNSKIGGAIDKANDFFTSPDPVETSVSEAWETVLKYVRDVEGKKQEDGSLILPQQTSLSFEMMRSQFGHVHPTDVCFDVALAVLETILPGKITSLRASLRTFNKVIRDPDRHPALSGLLPSSPIPPLPTLRDEAFSWEYCEPVFQKSVDDAINTAVRGRRQSAQPDRFGGRLGSNPLPDRRKGRQKRKKPPRNPGQLRKNHRRALSWLARHGFESRDEVYAFDDIADLLTADVVNQAAVAFVERSETSEALKPAKQTSSLTTYLGALGALARANDFEDEVIYAIEDVPYLLSGDDETWFDNSDRMAREREKFVKMLDRDQKKVLAIVRGPRALAAEARRQIEKWDQLGSHRRTQALHLGISATAMALQLVRASRTRNVNEMTSGGDEPELVEPAREGERAWVDIPRDRVKNRRAIEHSLPPWAWEIVSYWLDVGRPLWIEHNNREAQGSVFYQAVDNDFLFPGVGREGEISRATFGRAWNRGVQEFLGLRGLTTHVMRHVDVTIFLARFPGMYGAAASLIGDSERALESFYSRGTGREAADLFAEVLAEIDPLLDLNSPLVQRRKHNAS
ncbi:MAG: hypothetical protein KDK53_16825 [Maritimibacter sp.]|nr:hypothetical protein [Maritimibacter sp.]